MNDQTKTQTETTDMQCYDGVPCEPTVTADTEAATWVSDAMFDAYNG